MAAIAAFWVLAQRQPRPVRLILVASTGYSPAMQRTTDGHTASSQQGFHKRGQDVLGTRIHERAENDHDRTQREQDVRLEAKQQN